MAKATLNKGYLAALKTAAEPPKAVSTGEPLRLPLDSVEEDPDQPRTSFDQAEMAALVDSIALVGILQPIGVRALPDGRWRVVHGARRFRAARLAGLTEVPAVPLAEAQNGLVAQVIENQVRSNLSARDLAAAINRMFADGMQIKAISASVALPEYAVNHYRAVARFQPELLARLDRDDIRALYELHKAWPKAPERIAAEVASADDRITVTEARRIIARATSPATVPTYPDTSASTAATALAEGAAAPDPSPTLPTMVASAEPPLSQPVEAGEPQPADTGASPESTPSPRPARPRRPIFTVEADGRRGLLATDRIAAAAGHAVVLFADASEEVPATALRIVEVGTA